MLVIGIVVVLILVLTGGSDTSSAQGAAEKAVAAINGRDVNASKEVDCDSSGSMGQFDFKDIPTDLKAELTGSAKEEGDSAKAPMKMTAEGTSIEGDLVLQKKDGKWCVSTFAPKGRSGG